MKFASLLIPLCVGLTVACTGPSAPDSPGDTPDDQPAEETAAPAADAVDEEPIDPREAIPSVGYEPKTRIEPGLDEQSESARADLGQRLGLDAVSIEVVQAQAVMWPNSGLGCPEPDMGYMDVLTPGVLIRLRTGGKLYQYHGGKSSVPFLCEPAERIGKPLPPGSYDDGT